MQTTTTAQQGHPVGRESRTTSFLVRDLLRTREVREVIAFLVPEFMSLWAGRSPLKKMLARPLESVILKGVRPPTNDPFPSILDEKLIAGKLEAVLPLISSTLFDLADAVSRGMEALTPDQQEKALTVCISSFSDGRIGALITRLGRMIGRLHEQNPRFLTDAIKPGLQCLVENTDFGELREALDNSSAEVEAFAKMLNDVMWQYPAKLVLALSALPDLANASGVLLRESVGRFNQVSPDLVADIVLSLLRHLDGDILGQCIQEIAGLVHKIHTGSALIGDPGVPQFVQDLSKLVEDAAGKIDGATLAKAFVALEEDREVIGRTIADALKANPEVWFHQLRRTADKSNPRIRTMRHRLAALEGLPEEETVGAIVHGVSSLDLQEAAEVVNIAAQLFNRIQEMRPETLIILATQFAEGLDLLEVKSAVETVVSTLGESLAPVGRAFLPPLIKEVCRCMEPSEDEYEEDMQEAREMMRRMFLGEEVPS